MVRQQSKKRGIVYILSNEGIPDGLKIGKVEDDQLSRVKGRIRPWQSGSPYPYRIEYAAYADDVKTAENDAHEIHADKRMKEGGGREWFQISLAAAIKTLDRVKGFHPLTRKELAELRGEPTTTPKRETKAQVSRRTSSTKSTRHQRFTFDSIGVPLGATLTFVSDPQVTARVVSQDPPLIEFNGERISLAAAAKQFRSYATNGPRYWKYNGRILEAIQKGK